MNDNAPTTIEKLDPSVVNLTKAIGLTETGGKYDSIGDGGTSEGAYQWNNGPTPLRHGEVPGKFKLYAQQVGADPSDFSPANQDRVAYKKVEQWGKQGYKPAQIASMWDAGEGEPDAYTGKFKTGAASKTDTFDVPGYTKKVAENYARLMSEYNQKSQSSQPDPSTAAPQAPQSFTDQASGAVDKLGNALGGFVKGAIKAPVTLATRVGELAGVGIAKALPKYFDPQKAMDAANSTQTVPGLNMDVKPIGDENLETIAGEGLSTVALGAPGGSYAGALSGGLGSAGYAMQNKASPLKVGLYGLGGALAGQALQSGASALGKAFTPTDNVANTLVNSGVSTDAEAPELANFFRDRGIDISSPRGLAVGRNVLENTIRNVEQTIAKAAPDTVSGQYAPAIAELQNNLNQLYSAQLALNQISRVPAEQAIPGLASRVTHGVGRMVGKVVTPATILGGSYLIGKALQGNTPTNVLKKVITNSTPL